MMCLYQFMGNTKGNRTQVFQYVTNRYEEDNNLLFLMSPAGRTRNLLGCLQMGQRYLHKPRSLKHNPNTICNKFTCFFSFCVLC